jgi:hypothetical protein
LAYSPDTSFIMNQITPAWDGLRAGMRRLYPASNPRPQTAAEIFIPESKPGADEIRFNVNPIIFHLPERPGRRGANLYIVLSGWLSFEKGNLRKERLRTHGFGTQVGYFRAKPELLEHVYGAHYDIDETQPGHPVFHSQIRSMAQLGEQVRTAYILATPVCDRVHPILRNVRVPTAQMDVFSVILQICADHLISSASDQDAKDAFSGMAGSCGFFDGVAHRLAYLNDGRAPSCYRSPHWYAQQHSVAAGAR